MIHVIRNVHVDASGPRDVWMADGRFVDPANHAPGSSPDSHTDGDGGWLLPLAVDLCARLREPGATFKATIASETAAAAAAGVGTLCVPPDTQPVIDQPAVVDWIGDRAADAPTQVRLLGALTHGLEATVLADMDALLAAGCVGLAQPRRLPPAILLRQALQYASGLGAVIHLDPVDAALAGQGVVHAGRPAMRYGLAGIPACAESIGTAVALELARDTGARIHLGRLTTARALALVRDAKSDGVAVTCDVAAHQLLLDESALEGLDPAVRLDPPLRTVDDRTALVAALADGTVDAICSDHQPQDANAKTDPFPLTEPGGATIEWLWAAAGTVAQSLGWTPGDLAQRLVDTPARIIGQPAARIAPGEPADCVLLRRDAFTADAATLRSASRISPLHGVSLAARVAGVWRAGTSVTQTVNAA